MNPTANQLLNETLIRIEGAYAPSTIRAYKSNFLKFIHFCDELKSNPLPGSPDDVASFIASLAKSGLKSSSIRIAVAAISSIHKLNQLKDAHNTPMSKLNCDGCTAHLDDTALKPLVLERQY